LGPDFEEAGGTEEGRERAEEGVCLGVPPDESWGVRLASGGSEEGL